MRYFDGRQFRNPRNPPTFALPLPPVRERAPMQVAGLDYIFADVIGVISEAFAEVFGGGDAWRLRMSAYNLKMAQTWDAMTARDYGRGDRQMAASRRSAGPEVHEQAHMFGGFAARFQWTLCEIVCASHDTGIEVRHLGGANREWLAHVLTRFDEMMQFVVDATALEFFISQPYAVRFSDSSVRHPPISLGATREFALTHPGPGSGTVQRLVAEHETLRANLSALVSGFGDMKSLDAQTSAWSKAPASPPLERDDASSNRSPTPSFD